MFLSSPPNNIRNLIFALSIKGAVALETQFMELALMIDRLYISGLRSNGRNEVMEKLERAKMM